MCMKQIVGADYPTWISNSNSNPSRRSHGYDAVACGPRWALRSNYCTPITHSAELAPLKCDPIGTVLANPVHRQTLELSL